MTATRDVPGPLGRAAGRPCDRFGRRQRLSSAAVGARFDRRARGPSESRPCATHASGEAIFWSVRLPRVLLAALVGGGLAVVGATLQAIFRNPMADAGLLGVSSGAALGAVLAVHLGWAANVFLALPVAAFGGALVAILVVYVLAHVAGRPTASRPPAHRHRGRRAGERRHVGAAGRDRGVPRQDRALLAGRRPRGTELAAPRPRHRADPRRERRPRRCWRVRSTCSRSARTRRRRSACPSTRRASRSSRSRRSWRAPRPRWPARSRSSA